jgi:hypothetical protein
MNVKERTTQCEGDDEQGNPEVDLVGSPADQAEEREREMEESGEENAA